jgi:hypothetical protein
VEEKSNEIPQLPATPAPVHALLSVVVC